ncbi:MAG: prephenate dehydrogenase/arogenate dehydrogenase family protein [Burkholderiales bacterium]|nr:prephenate dehydrogenase/arogenate dehydrogenase family protein [Burkholderiales bacterium]
MSGAAAASTVRFQRLALLGVGLIGGSAALAWRAAGAVGRVAGFDRDAGALALAQARGVIDEAAASVAQAVADADLVLLAAPVGAMDALLDEVARHAAPFAVITDVGSTKGSVIESSFSLRRFVPGHPIAGGEMPGVQYAQATLFRDRLAITTPTDETHAEALARVEALWRAAGARVLRMGAEEHDRIFAAVSHLPHLLAFALVAAIASESDGAHKLGFAGAGFRDFTRIAAASPEMWRDVALANQPALSAELRHYRGWLERLQAAVDGRDAAALEAMFELASRTRRGQVVQERRPESGA